MEVIAVEARDERRRQLADAMNRRRAELRTTWDKVARRGGVSVATLRRARRGSDDLTLDTIVAIEMGLDWEPGYVEEVLSGRVPAPAARRKSHSASEEPPAGWGIDPKEWARWEPIDRENILGAIAVARAAKRAGGSGAQIHSIELPQERSA